jgi:hypothetical protein
MLARAVHRMTDSICDNPTPTVIILHAYLPDWTRFVVMISCIDRLASLHTSYVGVRIYVRRPGKFIRYIACNLLLHTPPKFQRMCYCLLFLAYSTRAC